MVSELINANPIIYEKKQRRARTAPSACDDDYALESIDELEVFDILFQFPNFLFNVNHYSENQSEIDHGEFDFSLTFCHII